MRVEQSRWSDTAPHIAGRSDADFVGRFGSHALISNPEVLDTVSQRYPRAVFLGCSTAGEIADTTVTDDSLVATAVTFEHSTVAVASAHVKDAADSHAVG